VDSSQGHAEACPRCGRPAAEGHACGKRAHQGGAAETGAPLRRQGDTHQRLGSSPTIGADNGEPDEERRPSGKTSLIGRNLGKNYRVIEPIGAGGMGIVYLVEHTKLKKRFAAKVLNSELAMNVEACARFEVEAHAVSQLDHDNIINVIDYGTSEEGLVFLVMEYLKGRTLQTRMDQAPLSREELLAVMLQVCHALGCAHEAGIVHRDMKPDNIFLNERMRGRPPLVKVLDFGISKARDVSLRDGRITKQGQVLGSPEYMSPEAARGDEVDSRADIYAVGIMLYELVTGAVPFRSENYLKVLQKHISEKPVPPRQLVPDVPEALEKLILRALAKHPDGRQQTTEELENELLAALPEEAERVLRARHTPSGGSWLLTPPVGVPIRPTTDPQVTPSSTAVPVTEEPVAEAAPTPTAIETAPRPRGPRSRRLLLRAGGAAAIAILVSALGLRHLFGGDEGKSAQPPPPVVATSIPAPAPTEPPPVAPPEPRPVATPEPPPVASPPGPAAEKIPFKVDSTPRGAAVFLNGKPVGKTPLAIQVARGRRPGQLKLVLRDHTPLARKVDLSKPVDLKVALQRLAPGAADAGPKPLDLRQTR
jgi:eukaryotic-like serine/threonine-protein kinase